MTTIVSKQAAKKATVKPAKSTKTHQVVVTFGVRSARLKSEFQKHWKKTDLSEAGFARELIREGLDRRKSTK